MPDSHSATEQAVEQAARDLPQDLAPEGNQPALPEAVAVEIYDQTYYLRGGDADAMQALAAIVDGKMRAVASHGGTVDSLRVAVLAALNIADDLRDLRARYAELAGSLNQTQRSVRSRAGSLSHLLDEAIDDTPEVGSSDERRVG